jgi:ABC-type amino acid transport substrate-binding protein
MNKLLKPKPVRATGPRRAATALGGVAALLGLLLPMRDIAAAGDPGGTLRVAVSRSLAPPFVIWRDGQPAAGIDVEIGRALAAQLQTSAEFIALPRLRVEAALTDGEADIACNLSAVAGSRRDGLPLGPTLFETQELLVGHTSAAGTDNIEQLPPGATVGTLQGQSYASMDPLFASGKVKRDDAFDEERLLRKLALNRHPYGVGTRQTIAWFTAQDGSDGLASWRLPLGSNPYRCTMSPRSRHDSRQLSAALERLQTSGRVEQIVGSFTQPPVAVVVSVRSPLRDVSRNALAELFMGQRQRLRDGASTEPVMAAGPERQQFLGAVLKRDAAQYRSAWAAQQFGGRHRAPVELPSAEAVKQHLQRNTDAIGYLPLALVDSTLRIVYLP